MTEEEPMADWEAELLREFDAEQHMAEQPFVAGKVGYSVPVSCCVLTDRTGVDHCKHPKPPLPRRWQLAKWRMTVWWVRNKPHVHRGPCKIEEDW